MIPEIFKQLKTSIIFLAFFTFLTGILYPTIITGMASFFFSHKADGSLIVVNQKVIGSSLIGQLFNDPKYFFGRPSATAPYPYNSLASSGSNLGLTNSVLIDRMKQTIRILEKADPSNLMPIPIDLITASGSGLDPHVSPRAAYYQVSRVSRIRHIPVETLQKLVERAIEKRQFEILGEEKVNILKLNLLLDDLLK